MDFELVGPIRSIRTIAVGRAIRGLARLADAMVEVGGES
jgi:hypothetical protein